MAFWGIEIKLGKPYGHQCDNERRRLHLSRAKLGSGSSKEKTVLVCNVGDKKPVYFCSLFPRKKETCSLSIEFEEYQEVTFSVEGPHNIHLSGFFYRENPNSVGNDYEPQKGKESTGKGVFEKSAKRKRDNFVKDDDPARASAKKTKQQENTPGAKAKGSASEAKPLQVRTYHKGLVVEDLSMGEPDGKQADRGKEISIWYIGKLKKNGKIFDSNIGKAPFKFPLGVGEVISGWDVGVRGMHVGDKQRLTIPPTMGYGRMVLKALVQPYRPTHGWSTMLNL